MKWLLPLMFFSSACLAQQPQQKPPTEAELNGRMTALQGQRNEANDRLVFLLGQVADLQAQLTTLKKEADSCKQPAEKK